MWDVPKNPGKKIKDTRAYLGEPYTITIIDLEYVIYRDLGNGYDFEVSGLNNSRKSFSAKIYVWQLEPRRIVEIVEITNTPLHLKDALGALAMKYLQWQGYTVTREE